MNNQVTQVILEYSAEEVNERLQVHGEVDTDDHLNTEDREEDVE